MSNPRLRDPLRRPRIPPPRDLLRGQRDGRLARHRRPLGARLRAHRQRHGDGAALHRDRLPAGADDAVLRRPPRAPAAPFRAAGDLRGRGGGVRRPRPARRPLLAGRGRRRRGNRRRPGADREDADPRCRRGDARAGGRAARRQRGPQHRLHRRRRGRPGPGRRAWSRPSASSRRCCWTPPPSTRSAGSC